MPRSTFYDALARDAETIAIFQDMVIANRRERHGGKWCQAIQGSFSRPWNALEQKRRRKTSSDPVFHS